MARTISTTSSVWTWGSVRIPAGSYLVTTADEYGTRRTVYSRSGGAWRVLSSGELVQTRGSADVRLRSIAEVQRYLDRCEED